MQPTNKLHIPLAAITAKQTTLTNARDLIDSARPLWVFALLPLFIINEGKQLQLGLALFAALWTLTGASTGVWGRWSPAVLSLLVLPVMALVTFTVTISPDLTREHLGYLCAALIAFFSLFTWARTEQRIRYAAYALTSIGALLALLVILQPLGGGAIAHAESFSLPFLADSIQKNVLGGAIVALMPIGASLLAFAMQITQLPSSIVHRPSSIGHIALTTVALAVMLSGIVLSQSRGTYIASVAALLVMFAFKSKLARLALGGALLALAALLPFVNPIQALSGLFRGDSVGDLSVRAEIWSRAAQAIGDFPLTGIGLGTFREVVPTLYPFIISDPQKVHHAHNLYLQIGADLGLPALAAFLVFAACLVVAGVRGWRRWEAQHNPELSWIAIGCVGALTAMLTHGLVDAVTWGTKPAFLAWAALGLLLAVGGGQKTRA